MDVSAWFGGPGTHGIRVGSGNREQWFKQEWTTITVKMDGQNHTLKLTPGFWRRCPEFRDCGKPIIRE